MSVRSRTFRLFVGIYAQELVDAIYRGALARPADPATRQRCAALLSKSPALSEVLRAALDSSEFRHRSLADLAPELVDALFRSLLERDPEPNARTAYSVEPASKGRLSDIAAEITQSKEFRERLFAVFAPSLTQSAFEALLGPAHGPQAASHYDKPPANSRELGVLLSSIVQSEDFRRTHRASFAREWLQALLRALLGREPALELISSHCKTLQDGADTRAIIDSILNSPDCAQIRTPALAAQLVGAIFSGLLGRAPDPQALAHYTKRIAAEGDIALILTEVIRSDEFARKYPRGLPRRPSMATTISHTTPGFSARDLQIPKVVFLHHPKSGGTTLHHILARAFAKDEICPERFNGLRHFPAGELARYRFFSGHFDLPSVHLIPGCKKIVTMVREPVARLISLYYFQRAHRAEVIEKKGLELARLANKYAMKEFFLAPEVRAHPAINNSLTRILVDTMEGERWEQNARLSATDSEQYAQLALRELSALDAFGLMERYAESTELICAALGFDAPGTIEARQVFDVITTEEPGLRRIEKEPVTGEIRTLIEGLVQTDRQVYARARGLFDERLATHRRRNSAIKARPEGKNERKALVREQ